MRRLLLSVLTLLAGPLAAQPIDYEARAQDLTTLARAFGGLHHIRRMCEPRRESEIWRDRMRRLIELEQPPAALHQDMVAAFNDSFREAERRFPYCDRDARDYAASLAAEGDEAASRLVVPLYRNMTAQ
jgi:uncharacterized protein (TIGR02301 family)